MGFDVPPFISLTRLARAYCQLTDFALCRSAMLFAFALLGQIRQSNSNHNTFESRSSQGF